MSEGVLAEEAGQIKLAHCPTLCGRQDRQQKRPTVRAFLSSGGRYERLSATAFGIEQVRTLQPVSPALPRERRDGLVSRFVAELPIERA